MFCAECCNDWGCEKGEHCCGGACISDDKCCDDHDCGDCEFCRLTEGFGGYCEPTGAKFGETCGLVSITEGGSPQLDCCDGLVCCGVHHGDDDDSPDDDDWDGGHCAECCGDWDCPKGSECHHGICKFECDHDKDCPDHTCCCKSGHCSKHCCDHHHDKPDKHPDYKKPEDTGGVQVDTLPSTGVGDDQTSAGWLGAAAVGAAAAYLASKKLKDETPEPDAAEE
jgi:LPXTG-motif cell wall-anchored protein